jgi:hypothetical protein
MRVRKYANKFLNKFRGVATPLFLWYNKCICDLTMDITTDWRYSDERMDIRSQGLNILMKKFGSEICSDGSPRYSNQSIYECVHDWVSQGNLRTDGIVAYYKAYYDPTKRSN